jgi:subtilisin family serine protease
MGARPAEKSRSSRGYVGAITAAAAALSAAVWWAPPPTQAAEAIAGPEQTIVVQTDTPLVHAGAVLGTTTSASLPGQRYEVHVPAANVPVELSRLQHRAGVRYAEVTQPVHATATPDDPCYVAVCSYPSELPPGPPTPSFEAANLGLIGAPAAWDITKGSGVRVAVLDSGVDPTHPDLAGKIVGAFNICQDSEPFENCPPGYPYDRFGHGTHVTGILAANTDNLTGMASLGWDVSVDEYQVLDSTGVGNTADVATAIYDAVARGDRVINMSFANFSCAFDPQNCGPDPDEGAAVEYAIAHNVVMVAAAGNDGFDSPTYPASFPGVLAVAATDQNGVIQSFSQWGSAADIAAPGLNIVSTWNDGSYGVLTGTSMAAPEVSAAAALMFAHNPTLSAPQITQLLEATASGGRGGHPINGGILNVPAALAAETHPPTIYNGYQLVGADGSVYSFGNVLADGDLAGVHLAKPVIGGALRSNGLGYWLVATDGGVFTFGNAAFHGSTGGIRLVRPVVGMADTPDGNGYWLVASDGGVFSFGDAAFHGSTGGAPLVRPVVGVAATPDGRGYWLVASDGGVFSFGDAAFHGSTGGVPLVQPIVGMAPTPDGKGYWLVASDGGVFSFGDAVFHGSTGGVHLAKPIVGIAATPDGRGYWLVAADGGVFTFGDARFWGSTGGQAIPAPVVSATN